jgi:hypothetical protein
MEETKQENTPQEGEFKMKKKPGRPKKLVSKKAETPKIEFKKENNANPESSTVGVSIEEPTKSISEVEVPKPEVQQVKEEILEKEEPIVEITEIEAEEEKTPEIISPTPIEVKQPKIELPENVDKLVNFMKETGGDINDYVRLNADYTNVDDNTLLTEYYKNTKPHLNAEEINFLMDEQFKVDDDYDEERVVRKKNLAKKEEVAKAHKFLENLKKEYYEEIKLRPTVNNEMTKATEFFSKFKQNQEIAKQQHEDFKSNTQHYFSEEFKGFDFAVGEKKFRYSVNNPNEVASAQSDISNVVKKFLNEKGDVIDVKGYHKAMYAASNADTIANHFYEQGKADATRNVIAQSKNIDSGARQTKAPDDIYLNGLKVKAVSGVNSSKLKIKRK